MNPVNCIPLVAYRKIDYFGVQNGAESELTVDEIGPDTDKSVFVADLDQLTTSNLTLPDSDGDGITDGEEDLNKNGICDVGESNPVPKCGDVTDDCQTDLEDLVQALKIVTDGSVTGRAAGDCDGDNQFGTAEALEMFKKLAK